ncbi:MAG: T9SS C-terminal target domain-containing protein [Stygiobacter sp.]|nr:MAG: T9SS C-terminal target domain-containing protein [Stygiobacter sp.]
MDASLPVELTSFTGTAYGSIVALDWATATEVNNYGFNVERASMVRQNSPQAQLGMTWEKIAFVQGHGNSNSPKIYSFQDGNPSVGKVQYRLKQIDFNGVFEYSPIVEVKVEAPSQLKLAQNYPNPFNPETTISFQIPFASHVTLKVYDVLGREVATLVDEFKQAGTYVKTLHATSLPSGVYFYKLQTDNGFSETKKLMLMK